MPNARSSGQAEFPAAASSLNATVASGGRLIINQCALARFVAFR